MTGFVASEVLGRNCRFLQGDASSEQARRTLDDQPDIRETDSKILESVGAEVLSAASADEVEQTLATRLKDIDVILLDLQMPARSGFDTLKHIRSIGFDRPVVAFTAQAMKGEQERCLKEGFDDYISKPIDTRKMLDKVSGFLSNRASENGPTRVLIVEDHVDAAQSLAMLLGLEGWEVRTAGSGAEALEVVSSFVPHACLIDLGLPDMDGHALVGRLRALPALAGTRFVAATGRDRVAAAAGGGDFDAHMTKPLDPARIVEFVEGARNGD
jgi:two-component system CheB/CheR fusion protein